MKEKYLLAVDLDDTLVQTDALNSAAYRLAIREAGVEIPEGYFEEHCSGRHYRDFLPEILGSEVSAERMEAVHERKKELYSACIDRARPNLPLCRMLEDLRATGLWCTALVTTGNTRNSSEILQHFGLTGLFDAVITASDVEKQKPDGEGYEKAMAMLGIPPERTVIVEDSETGLQAARASGAHVWKIDRF